MHILVFVVALLVSTAFTRLVRDYSIARAWVSVASSDRHVHTRPVPRLGGVAIFMTLCCMALRAYWLPGYFGARKFPLSDLTLKILGPATIIFVLDLIDDFRGVNAYVKFAVQAGAAAFFVLERYRNLPAFDLGKSSPFGMAGRASTDNSLGAVDHQCFQFD
jgi:UDP-GlcNAc:undecaprenyl-phosphate/decaprenyl-phosphate GlcNAc-1-phosphate transferase